MLFSSAHCADVKNQDIGQVPPGQSLAGLATGLLVTSSPPGVRVAPINLSAMNINPDETVAAPAAIRRTTAIMVARAPSSGAADAILAFRDTSLVSAANNRGPTLTVDRTIFEKWLGAL